MRSSLFNIIALLTLLMIGAFFYSIFQIDESSFAVSSGGGTAEPVAAAAPAETAHPEGESLFKANCAACHKLNRALTGPALGGVSQKYAGEEEWLYKWIKNAPGLIAQGDAKAVALYEEWAPNQMQAFPSLSDDQVGEILAWIDEQS